jgi:hypothetical protein
MSALPPEADMLIVGVNVCYVPEADIFKSCRQVGLAPRGSALRSRMPVECVRETLTPRYKRAGAIKGPVTFGGKQ